MVKSANFKNVVITGGAGFIGSHLCELYLEDGARVTVLDNLVTGARENIKHLLDHKNFRFIEHDVSTPLPKLEFANAASKADLLLHFACPASPIDFAKIPLEILKVDSLGTFHTLDSRTAWLACSCGSPRRS